MEAGYGWGSVGPDALQCSKAGEFYRIRSSAAISPKQEPSSDKQAKNTRSATVPNAIPSSPSKARQRPEAESASTSSLEPCHQSSGNAKLPVQSETSSSPPFTQSSESSASSDSVTRSQAHRLLRPVQLLQDRERPCLQDIRFLLYVRGPWEQS